MLLLAFWQTFCTSQHQYSNRIKHSYVWQPNSYKWFSSCYRVPSIVGVVQEKIEVWEPQETTLGILEDIFHFIDAIIKMPAKKNKQMRQK